MTSSTIETPDVVAERSGRERIMDVAAGSFLDRGYDATSLRQIADAVGMKAGSLYYHFASKDELLTEVLQRGIDVMNEAFDAAAAAAPAATTRAPERITVHVRAHLAALYENGPYTAAHVTTFRTAPPTVRDDIVKVRDAYEARWTQLLRDMQADGHIAADVNVTLARLSLFGVMNSSVDWFDRSRRNLDDFAAAIARQFFSGVAA